MAIKLSYLTLSYPQVVSSFDACFRVDYVIHTHTLARSHARTLARTHARTHAHIHAHTHVPAHSYIIVDCIFLLFSILHFWNEYILFFLTSLEMLSCSNPTELWYFVWCVKYSSEFWVQYRTQCSVLVFHYEDSWWLCDDPYSTSGLVTCAVPVVDYVFILTHVCVISRWAWHYL